MGKVAARYDEFFFNNPETTGGTVRRKDYVATPDAKTFLEQESPAADTWYNTSDGGKRIIYEQRQPMPLTSTRPLSPVIQMASQIFRPLPRHGCGRKHWNVLL